MTTQKIHQRIVVVAWQVAHKVAPIYATPEAGALFPPLVILFVPEWAV